MGTATAKEPIKVNIKNEWCKACGICVSFCPKNVLAQNEDGKAYVKNPENCIGCGNCEIYCPDFAVSLGRINDESQRSSQVDAR